MHTKTSLLLGAASWGTSRAGAGRIKVGLLYVLYPWNQSSSRYVADIVLLGAASLEVSRAGARYIIAGLLSGSMSQEIGRDHEAYHG